MAQTLRPTRLASLLPVGGGWGAACVHLMQILTGMWGGPANLIVPFRPDDGHVDDAVWNLVERFDPDVWARYHHTGEAIEIDDPARFEELVLSRSVGHEADAHWINLIRDDLRRTVLNDVEPPPALLERIRTRTWTVSAYEPDRIEYVATNQSPTGTLTVDVAKLATLPLCVVMPDLSALSDTMRLLFASRWGSLNPQLRAALVERDVEVVDVALTAEDEREIRLLSWGLLPRKNSTFGSALHAGGAQYPEASAGSIGFAGLGRFHRRSPTDEMHVVVLGSSMDDFAFALGLRRERQSVVWCPFECGENPSTDLLIDILTGLRSVVHMGRPPIAVASRSLNAAQMQLFADALAGLGLAGDVIVASDWAEVLMAAPSGVRGLWKR